MNNVDRVNSIYAAFGRGDVASIVEMTTEDVEWGYDGKTPKVISWLERGRGRDRVLGYFKGVSETMQFHKFEPKVVAGAGNDVLAIVEVDWTAPLTGKRVTGYEAMWFTFDDRGRITRYRPVLDSAVHFAAYET